VRVKIDPGKENLQARGWIRGRIVSISGTGDDDDEKKRELTINFP